MSSGCIRCLRRLPIPPLFPVRKPRVGLPVSVSLPLIQKVRQEKNEIDIHTGKGIVNTCDFVEMFCVRKPKSSHSECVA